MRADVKRRAQVLATSLAQREALDTLHRGPRVACKRRGEPAGAVAANPARLHGLQSTTSSAPLAGQAHAEPLGVTSRHGGTARSAHWEPSPCRPSARAQSAQGGTAMPTRAAT